MSTLDPANGTYKDYYNNGQLKTEINFFNGRYHGKQAEYSFKGKLIFCGCWDYNKKVGYWFNSHFKYPKSFHLNLF